MTQQETTFYGFRSRKTGELVRINAEHTLSSYEGDILFKADSPAALSTALFENTPWYNASEETPRWGPFTRDELEPVKVTVVQEVAPVDLPEVINLKSVEVRDIPYQVARRYVGHEFDVRPKDKHLVFWLAELPENASLEAFRDKAVGQAAYSGDRFSKRHVYAVLPVPEDYEPLCKKPSALIIASGSYYD